MLVLGIDPGSTSTGWGVVRLDRGRYHLVGAGCVRTRSDDPMAGRLVAIHGGVAAVIAEHRPDTIAIEQIFAHRSAESALRLGQARGVALLAAGQAGYEPVAYNPSV
ncbi:MAG TPA: crossover junction endodeoxyribonuclease RuvC, partial [Myxococcota bacterium]|nr:crossover junction endodeoxyribonuclease RuvC [Myxococcota bacterium]